MKRVLVTGARGFLGRHCLAALASRGVDLHAVSSRPIPPNAEVKWHRADLLDDGQCLELMQRVRPSHLLHLAWTTTPHEYHRDLVNLDWVHASVKLLQAFSARGGARAVIAGSCAEYDWTQGRCLEYKTPLAPRTLYAHCKAAFGEIAAAFGREIDVSVAWGRVFFPYGPGQNEDRFISAVVRAFLSGRPAPPTSGEHKRDFIYVTDVAEAFAALVDCELTGPINIASGKASLIRDVLRYVGRSLGRPELVAASVTDRASDEPPVVEADVSRLRNELKCVARVDLEEGIEMTVDAFRKCGIVA